MSWLLKERLRPKKAHAFSRHPPVDEYENEYETESEDQKNTLLLYKT